ncbi:MAG: aldolase/citrate lyase family protein [Lentisphaeria bacterium]
MFNPKKSVTLEKLRKNEVVICYKSNLSCPRSIEIAAMNDFDCIWVCNEHVSNDNSVMESQILAAKSLDTDIVVRVPRGSYSDLVRPLESDASGIMVPHVMSEADAKKVAYNVRFYPVGRRAVDGGNRDGAYCNMAFKDYIKFVNRNRFVIAQIEDVEALDELDAICAVDGIDIIFFGPADFSQSIGIPGECDAPEVVAARKRVAAAALKAGKFAGTVGGPGNIAELVSEGFHFINMGADVLGLSTYCAELSRTARENLKK